MERLPRFAGYQARADLALLDRISRRELEASEAIQSRARQVARLHLRLRRARAALRDALLAAGWLLPEECR